MSIDDRPDYEEKLQWTCANIHLENQLWEALIGFLRYSLELKWRSSLHSRNSFLLFPSEFTEGQNQFKSMVSFGWVKPLL
jgi:hypothetical protein